MHRLAARARLVLATAWALTATAHLSTPARAQSVTAAVDVANVLATVPEYGFGIHTSVYDNSLWHIDSPGTTADDAFDLLPSRLADAGVNVLRYPGGGYADVFHFSLARPSWESGITGSGLSPWWGLPVGHSQRYGYVASHTDFGSFVQLLDATNSKAVITVNTGSALKFDNPNRLGIPTHAGQPQEAAAWVAYANADAAIYGTPQDIPLGVDAEGNDWKTAGYWARLRASTPSEFASWATADGVHDARNALLAVDRAEPAGITYWEIGNENFGTNYYGGPSYNPADPNANRGYTLNYAAP